MYIRVLFMSEFPGLRYIVKIRDFFPYIRGESDPLAKTRGTKPVRPATLQIHTISWCHSSDHLLECGALFRSILKLVATLQITVWQRTTLQVPLQRALFSWNQWREMIHAGAGLAYLPSRINSHERATLQMSVQGVYGLNGELSFGLST